MFLKYLVYQGLWLGLFYEKLVYISLCQISITNRLLVKNCQTISSVTKQVKPFLSLQFSQTQQQMNIPKNHYIHLGKTLLHTTTQ